MAGPRRGALRSVARLELQHAGVSCRRHQPMTAQPCGVGGHFALVNQRRCPQRQGSTNTAPKRRALLVPHLCSHRQRQPVDKRNRCDRMHAPPARWPAPPQCCRRGPCGPPVRRHRRPPRPPRHQSSTPRHRPQHRDRRRAGGHAPSAVSETLPPPPPQAPDAATAMHCAADAPAVQGLWLGPLIRATYGRIGDAAAGAPETTIGGRWGHWVRPRASGAVQPVQAAPVEAHCSTIIWTRSRCLYSTPRLPADKT
jgi:hypothetical protein